LYQLNIFSIFI